MADMNEHKRMAGADRSDNFGVDPLPGRDGKHPDVGMKQDAMGDDARSPQVKSGARIQQGAPDHGSMGKDHFNRDGKA